MAKATRQAAVTETKVVELEPERIVLELSREEAEALTVLTYRVCGHPRRSARGVIDEIRGVLVAAGLNAAQLYDRPDLSTKASGGVRFADRPGSVNEDW